MIDLEQVGKRIRTIRKEKYGMSQADLARKIYGYANNYPVSRMESGNISDVMVIDEYARALDVSLDYLLTGFDASGISSKYILNENDEATNAKLISESSFDENKEEPIMERRNYIEVDSDAPILGVKDDKIVYQSEKGNQNTMLIAPVGSGRVYCFMRPNIKQAIARGESFIVSDVSGQLRRDFDETLKKEGYKIAVLDTTDVVKSDSYNLLKNVLQHERPDYNKVSNFANMLINNHRYLHQNALSADDEFWNTALSDMLTMYIYYLFYEDRDHFTIGRLSSLILESDIKTIVDSSVKSDDDDLRKTALSVRSLSSNVRNSAKLMLDTTVRYNPTVLDNIFSNDSEALSVANIYNNKTAIFLIPRCTDRHESILVSMTLTYMLNGLMDYYDGVYEKDKYNNLLYVNVFVDDAYALGKIGLSDDDLAKILNRCCKHQIRFNMTVNNYTQLEDMYHKAALYLPDMFGNVILYLHNSDKASEQYIGKLVDKNMINTMEQGQEILLINGKKPVVLDKYVPV